MDARLNEAIDRFCANGRANLLVALDFDGTLAPFVDDPMTAVPLPEAAASLQRLADAGVTLALVSGRNLSDLAERAAPPLGTYLVGSHGAERGHISTGGLWTEGLLLTEEQSRDLARLIAALREIVIGRPGAWVQVKPSAAVVHTRQAAPEDQLAATADAAMVARRCGLRPMHGKNVVEIAVIDTSKGQALDALRRDIESSSAASSDPTPAAEPMRSCHVLFAGDDTTDEDAFAVLRPGDVGIKVGDGTTRAEQRVADPAELSEVLAVLADRLAG